MPNILRVKSKWTGFNGAPGYTNFYFRDFSTTGEPLQSDADSAVARTSTFWANVKSRFPSVVSIAVQGDVEVIDPANGQLASVFSVTPPVVHQGTATATTYSGPTGMVINWRSAGVRNGRRVRGRTFLVPVATDCFQNDGTIDPTKLAAVQSAATDLAAQTGTPDLGIWCRPTTPGGTDGQWFACNGATVPDLAAVLRSRRD
jgi:hypothetical protein